jgi:hypothetical protein
MWKVNWEVISLGSSTFSALWFFIHSNCSLSEPDPYLMNPTRAYRPFYLKQDALDVLLFENTLNPSSSDWVRYRKIMYNY